MEDYGGGKKKMPIIIIINLPLKRHIDIEPRAEPTSFMVAVN